MKPMTEIEIAAAMTELQTLYVEKTGKQPKDEIDMRLTQSGSCHVSFYTRGLTSTDFMHVTSKDARDALAEMRKLIEDLESEEDAKRRVFAEKLAEAIEAGNAANVPEVFVLELQALAKKNSANALTQERAA